MVRIPAKAVRTVVGTTAGLAAVGVGTAFAVGGIPGTEGVPGAVAGFVQGTAEGLTSLTQNLPLLVVVGGAAALLVLLKS